MSDFGLGVRIVDEQALTDALRWHGLIDDIEPDELQKLIQQINQIDVKV